MTKKRLPAKLRRMVRQRAQGYCEYCICPEFCATQLHSIYCSTTNTHRRTVHHDDKSQSLTS